ncbi:MAG: cyclic nucleotide-binding domain-containing protein, partial [Deltaproteobacteria bacterium]
MTGGQALLADSESRLDAGDALAALRGLAPLLAAEPANLTAWHRLAVALLVAGEREAGLAALASAGEAEADGGNLPMALVAHALLSRHDATGAAALLDHCARIYAADSGGVARDKAVPPPFPSSPTAPSPLAENLPPGEVVRLARAAAERAAAAARERPSAPKPAWPIFSTLDAGLFRQFVSVLVLRTVTMDAVVIEQGEEARSFFVVASGTLRVMRGEAMLGVLRAGAFFGEMALLARTTRQARVVAVSRAELFEIEASAIEDLARRAPDLVETIAGYCRRRLLDNVARTSSVLQALPEE